MQQFQALSNTILKQRVHDEAFPRKLHGDARSHIRVTRPTQSLPWNYPSNTRSPGHVATLQEAQ